MKITLAKNTNQRDGTTYAVQIDMETRKPLCPHCSHPMTRVQHGDTEAWENCECRCWWVGAGDASYPLQVVFPIRQP